MDGNFEDQGADGGKKERKKKRKKKTVAQDNPTTNPGGASGPSDNQTQIPHTEKDFIRAKAQ